MSMTDALIVALRRARRAGVASSIYLTEHQTDQLLEEMGTRRDRRMTRRPPVDRFDGVPVYPDKDVGMVVYSSTADGHSGLVLL